MGGENEFKTKAKKTGTKGESTTVGELRIHESKGEIHFHDDVKNLKCAVPVVTWYEMWQRMWKEVNGEFNFVDSKNGTALFAKVSCIQPESGGKSISDIHIYIDETDVSEELKAMSKFMEE